MSSLGTLRLSALIVGNTIGAGIYFLPVSLAPFGGISLIGWLVTSLGSILLALVFARLARTNSQAGGPYAYTKQAFGSFFGFQSAWGYWAATWMSNAALAVAAVSYSSVFWPALATNRVLSCGLALFIIWGATLINAWGVQRTSSIQVFITILKISPLILVGIAGLFALDPSNFQPFNQSSMSDMSAINAVATLTLWAFIGLESGTVPSQHVKNPHVTIPRATIFGTILCAVIYMTVTVAVLGLIPADQLAQSSAPLADAAKILFGNWAAHVVAGGAVLSAVGCLIGWVLLQAQMPYAAAIDNSFPAIFAKLSKHHVPIVGLILSSLLMTVVMLLNYVSSLAEQFTVLVNISIFVILVPYALSTVADFMNQRSKGFKAMSLSVLAFIYASWLIIGAGSQAVIWGLGFLGLGIPVYIYMRRKNASGQASELTAE
jgi:APA family basic amino acid/polyamine antiporter